MSRAFNGLECRILEKFPEPDLTGERIIKPSGGCLLICPFCGTLNESSASVCRVCGGRFGSESQYLPQGHKLGRYELGKVLGQGGFGVTYAGRDTLLGRGVAIKEFFPQGSVRQVLTVIPPRNIDFTHEKTRFLEEARLLAQFDHPGIVRVWDTFEAFDTVYLVMEFLKGETLGKRMEQPIFEQEVMDITRQILAALDVVHSCGMLHRDIKPDNIFLAQEGRAVLIDFGSARTFAQGEAKSHTRLVTPGYAPPEQYASQAKFGPYTDLYALGATLYHALLGEMPPAATDRLLGVALKPLPAHVSFSLRALLERCLALEVAKRPQAVQDVLTLFEEGARSPRRNTPQNLPSPQPEATAISLDEPISPSGDQLVKAIRFSPEGGTLRLTAGKFVLPQALEIKKSLKLIGLGSDKTTIVGSDEGFVLYSSSGTLHLEGLTLEHTGKKPSDVLVVSHRLNIEKCIIRGGIVDASGDGGNGIVLLGSADATIKQSVCERNGSSGVFLSDSSRAYMEGNRFSHNGSCGVAYFGRSSGVARKNVCSGNDLHGVVVTDDAQPILEENVLERNRECGVAFLGHSRGRAFDNALSGNVLHPIFVAREARPSLQGNSGHVVRR